MAASLGKMPTTSVRRLISLLTRSSGLVQPHLAPVARAGRRRRRRCRARPRPASLRRPGTGGRACRRSRRAARRRRRASGWAKIVRIAAATISAVPLGTRASTLRRKWTRQRCQAAPSSTARDGALEALVGVGDHQPHARQARGPAGERRKAVQKAPSSLSPTASPSTSRSPSALTPVAITTALDDDLAPLVGLEVGGVEEHVGEGRRGRARRSRNGADGSSSSAQMRLTSHLVIPASMPRPRTRSSTLRVRHAVDVGLHDHRPQGPVDAPARLEQGREEAALAQLGDPQLESPALVESSRSRAPLRWVVRSALRSYGSAPIAWAASSSISACSTSCTPRADTSTSPPARMASSSSVRADLSGPSGSPSSTWQDNAEDHPVALAATGSRKSHHSTGRQLGHLSGRAWDEQTGVSDAAATAPTSTCSPCTPHASTRRSIPSTSLSGSSGSPLARPLRASGSAPCPSSPSRRSPRARWASMIWPPPFSAPRAERPGVGSVRRRDWRASSSGPATGDAGEESARHSAPLPFRGGWRGLLAGDGARRLNLGDRRPPWALRPDRRPVGSARLVVRHPRTRWQLLPSATHPHRFRRDWVTEIPLDD